MSEDRPNPDDLLAKVAATEPDPKRGGRLKIFFGYAAGVGKTYAMLSAARGLAMKRGEILVGYVEPHGRSETESLLLGLDILPYRSVEYRGVTLCDFDLDAALRAKPRLVLVDELAHTNAEDARHPKRWQDIEELLEAGVDVWTTVNVQHLESLNDVVGKITGIVVRETVPDRVFDRADEVELVDLPPEELLERFREGKVYVPDRAAEAMRRFFAPDRLVALRELALRRTAEHVNRQVELGRRGLASRPIWAVRDRLLVAVGPSPTSAMLIRATRRMAADLRAPWIAAAVETPRTVNMPDDARMRLEANLRLAESMGAETASLTGSTVADALVRYAHEAGVNRIVIGKTAEPRWRQILRGSVVDELLKRSGEIDIFVIRGDEQPHERAKPGAAPRAPLHIESLPAAAAAGVMAVCLAFGLLLREVGLTDSDVLLTFLAGVAAVAYFFGRLLSVGAAVAAVLLFNFFFTEPFYTLRVYDARYLATFAVLLGAALLVSELVSRVRVQAELARRREREADALARVTSKIAASTGKLNIAMEAEGELRELLGRDVAVLLKDSGPVPSAGFAMLLADPREHAVADWAMNNRQPAGRGTDTLPESKGTYIPLVGSRGHGLGAVGVQFGDRTPSAVDRRLLEAASKQIALSLERDELAETTKRAEFEAHAERLRAGLLSAVSHDLRTPLAAISGTAGGLLEANGTIAPEQRRELLESIVSESGRLARLVDNLLQMTRLEAGAVRVRKEWYPLDEVVGSVLARLGDHPPVDRVHVDLSADLPLVPMDSGLIEQVLINLLENADRHAPGSPVELLAEAEPTESPFAVRIEVLDRGPGLPPVARDRLFERFVRGSEEGTRGSGLGLAICRAAVEAHGGTIDAANRPGGGARFSFTLPLDGGIRIEEQDEPVSEDDVPAPTRQAGVNTES